MNASPAPVLTRRLAARCENLVALDVSTVALAAARRRCAGLPVSFVNAEVSDGWLAGRFDLVVLFEVLYFLDAGEVARCARRGAARNLGDGGEILLINWLGPSKTALSGEAAAEIFIAAGAAEGMAADPIARTACYRIDRMIEHKLRLIY